MLASPAHVVRFCSLVAAMIAPEMLSTQAHAQSISTQVFETTIPFSYNRGRNESVTDRPRPEYDPTGIDLEGFTLLPAATASLGYTDNVFQTASPKTSTAIASFSPKLLVRSNWAVNSVQLNAGGNFVRYLSQSSRNEDGWNVDGQGRFDFAPDMSLNLGAGTRRLFETPFSGSGVPISRSALPIQATLLRGLADFKLARVRIAVSGDHSIYNYLPATDLSGTPFSRDSSDRAITRGTGHVEYGLTPDVGIFGQVTYTRTGYRIPLAPGVANRDSSEVNTLVGASFDLTALLRGSIGVGYISRTYDSPLYRNLSGVSVDGKIEYFLTQLTTITLVGRRDVEDSQLTGASGYFNNGIAARVDHEVLRNLVLNAGVDYEHDSYRGISGSSDIYRLSGGALFLISREIRIDGTLGYRRRSTSSTLIGASIDEFRAALGITFRR